QIIRASAQEAAAVGRPGYGEDPDVRRGESSDLCPARIVPYANRSVVPTSGEPIAARTIRDRFDAVVVCDERPVPGGFSVADYRCLVPRRRHDGVAVRGYCYAVDSGLVTLQFQHSPAGPRIPHSQGPVLAPGDN